MYPVSWYLGRGQSTTFGNQLSPPPHGFQGLTSDRRSWGQAPSLAELSGHLSTCSFSSRTLSKRTNSFSWGKYESFYDSKATWPRHLSTLLYRGPNYKKKCCCCFLNRFCFLLDKLTKGLVKKGQSPCHHQIAQILLSLLLPPSPHLGSSGRGGRTSCWRDSCWSGPTSLYIADEAPTVDTGQGLCKQARWERFNTYQLCWWGHWSSWPSPCPPTGQGWSRCRGAHMHVPCLEQITA